MALIEEIKSSQVEKDSETVTVYLCHVIIIYICHQQPEFGTVVSHAKDGGIQMSHLRNL